MSKSTPKAAPAVAAAISPLALLSPADAADALGVGRTKLLELVRAGRVRCVMMDSRIRVPVEAIQEFRDALPSGYIKGKPLPGKAA
jgi:excisionase family DNA binding protein